MSELKARARRRRHEALHRQEGGAMVWELREAGLGATARIPDRPDNWEGWEDAAVPPEKVGDYLRDFRKLLDKYGYAVRALRALRPGLHPHADRLRPQDGRRHRADAAPSRTRRPTWCSATAARSPASTATASRAASCCRRCSGREVYQAFREFKAIWDPDGQDEPGQVIDAYKIDENLRLGPALPPAPARRPTSSSRTTTAASRTRPCAASASAICRREDGAAPCARATW